MVYICKQKEKQTKKNFWKNVKLEKIQKDQPKIMATRFFAARAKEITSLSKELGMYRQKFEL